MKEKRPIPLYKALNRRIILPAVALWLICMLLLSCAVGKDYYNQLLYESPIYANTMRAEPQNDLPGNVVYEQLCLMGLTYHLCRTDPLFPFVLPQHLTDIVTGHPENWESIYGFQAAVAVYNPDGSLQLKSGDCLYFPYSSILAGPIRGYGYVDLEALPGGNIYAQNAFGSSPYTLLAGLYGPNLRLSGYWGDHNNFIPAKIESLLDAAEEDDEHDLYRTVYENPDIPVVESIHTVDARGGDYNPGAPVWIPGVGFMEIRDAVTLKNLHNSYNPLNARIITTSRREDGSVIRLLICIRPLAYAAVRLLPAYLVSGILLWVGLWLCLKSVKKHLRDPLEVINRAWENDRAELSVFARSPYLELQTLGAHFNTAQQDRHSLRNQVTQLQTALQYAKNAEENRRKMVSAIAHELKTPLAVIHGYAEGLQDGIAPEKQQQYLSIILDETEKTDALVRQMLELSRLEAGKVRLSADPVDLTALTEAVLQKQSLAAQAKDLQWELDLHPAAITADEARIEQVLSNYISNAIRYSPRGGTIRISLSAWTDHVRFFIENESAPLSQEALEKVWESFYRADTARDRTGTGLGLAITKSIVELHRGTCAVRNTQTGVEFSFRLPTGSASPKTMSS